MAKKSVRAREEKRYALVQKYAARRKELLSQLKDTKLSVSKRMQLRAQLESLPRNSSPSRLTRRCFLTGRSRGVMTRRFGLSRHMLRIHGMQGDIPGLSKSS